MTRPTARTSGAMVVYRCRAGGLADFRADFFAPLDGAREDFFALDFLAAPDFFEADFVALFLAPPFLAADFFDAPLLAGVALFLAVAFCDDFFEAVAPRPAAGDAGAGLADEPRAGAPGDPPPAGARRGGGASSTSSSSISPASESSCSSA